MNTAYWAGEFVKVILVYIGVMYIWPSIIFRKYLAKKSKTFRFAFCSTASIVLISTLVLGLGLIHLLNKWIFLLVFYGSLLVSIFYNWKPNGKAESNIFRYFHGTYGSKLLILRGYKGIKNWLGTHFKSFFKYNKNHILEYMVLMVVTIFGVCYFSYAAFQNNCYGTSDMYVHHSWVYGLMEGKIFYAGVYPEAMHCVIYAMHEVSGVRAYSIMLFLGGINTAAFMIAIYCFLKEIFRWRFSAIFTLFGFLCVDVLSINAISSMSRLQWTLPQEFGFPAMFLCATYLLRFLYAKDPEIIGKKKILQYLKDENLFIFLLALATTIACHFYTTIMAFFICVPIALSLLTQVFRRKKLCGLIIASIAGVLLAVAPMGLALAEGIPFQGSIGWAMGVIQDSKEENEDTQLEDYSTQQDIQLETNADEMVINNDILVNTEVTNGTVPQQTSKFQRIEQKIKSCIEELSEKLKLLYEEGYVVNYGEDRAKLVVAATGLGIVLWFLTRVLLFLFGFIKKLGITKDTKRRFQGYIILIITSVVYMIMYTPTSFGLPKLIDVLRLCSTEQIFVVALFVIPVDIVFTLLHTIGLNVILQLVSVGCTLGIYFGCIHFNIFHGYLWTAVTRYNEAVNVTDDIVKTYPKYQYTIISPTDELYQTIEYGRHEELLTFARNVQQKGYTLPTRYLFLYIEKQPLQYSHMNFPHGPSWLADESYEKYYEEINVMHSGGSELLHGEISDELADFELMVYGKLSDSYVNLGSRLILESKMNRWCTEFKEKYGNDISVYYEDDRFVCYRIEQNTSRLYNLGE